MPNWTWNMVEIRGDKDIVLGIKDTLNNSEEENVFDFNKVLPMPTTLDIEEGSTKTPAVLQYLYTEKGSYMAMLSDPDCRSYLENLRLFHLFHTDPAWLIETHQKALQNSHLSAQQLYDMGKQYVENMKNYGFYTWYDWCCANWGTKWNSCDAEILSEGGTDTDYCLKYGFNTAWSMPYGIYERLHLLYPEALISVTYIDEDDIEGDEHCIEFGGEK